MTSTPDPRGYPAPGSGVPGAPPRLQRALTPADGMPDVTASGCAAESPMAQPVSILVPSRGSSRLIAAAAMLGVAAGLEFAGALSRRRSR